MEPPAASHVPPADGELADVPESSPAVASEGLRALLVALSPLALAAWIALGVALYRLVT
jgi:hypothetical protein